jgi:1,4-dihydroxy-6-naphthoate synthase
VAVVVSRERLRIGISSCPNDTFAFHGLLAGEVDSQGFDLEFELLDVQALNERLLRGDFDAAKASFAAALDLARDVVVLRVGAAIGRGVGPVVLAPAETTARLHGEGTVLAPGAHTTATLLWRLLHPGEGRLKQVVFSEIMPALARGDADLGVCIHEGRFTYGAWKLRLVEDLGATWERETGLPLPLGGILGRKSLGTERILRLETAIRASLEYGRAHPDRAVTTMRRWAQEDSDEVLWKHVELYVTDETHTLSAEAQACLSELARRARALGIGAAADLNLASG